MTTPDETAMLSTMLAGQTALAARRLELVSEARAETALWRDTAADLATENRRLRAIVAALDAADAPAGRGMYYTPPAILDIIDPQSGAGAWLTRLADAATATGSGWKGAGRREAAIA